MPPNSALPSKKPRPRHRRSPSPLCGARWRTGWPTPARWSSRAVTSDSPSPPLRRSCAIFPIEAPGCHRTRHLR
eukprot:7614899-Pyramimonas_sp.AAC.1